ncbi:MAG: ribosome biogenesis GTPase Der [Candidatus Dasytiphilus stammeri]
MTNIVKIALVGRPNVGKSTLFNKITSTHDALVTDHCNMTRDRNYGITIIKEYQFIVIDTAGLDENQENKKNFHLGSIDHKVLLQFNKAIEESNIVLFIVDAHSGIMPGDFYLIKKIRSSNKPLFIAVNKIDVVSKNISVTDFYSLGVKNIYFIAASSSRGVTKLLEQLYLWCKKNLHKNILISCKNNHVFTKPHSREKASVIIYLAIVGRPNVGKSTLINRLLGEERVIVFNMPGTTRDSIYIPFEYKESIYCLIDTAGLRKRTKVFDEREKLSIRTTLHTINKANVVIIVMDASHDAIFDQDLSILNLILKNGRSLVIVVNKWDTVSDAMKQKFQNQILFRLKFVDFVRIHFISALKLSTQDVENIFKSVTEAYSNSTKKLTSRKLTRIMQNAIEEHQLPLSNHIKLKYAHSGGYNPPVIVIHGHQVNKLPNSYKNYLKKYFRRSLELNGTTINICLKEGK